MERLDDFRETIAGAFEAAEAHTQGLIHNVLSRFPVIQNKVHITPKEFKDLLAYLCNE